MAGTQDQRPYVVVRSGGRTTRVPLAGRLFVGREVGGVDPAARVLLDDPKVSRNHLEIRLDDQGRAVVFDTSTNGTRLNGVRLQRAVPVALSPGDVLSLGQSQLEVQLPARPDPPPRRLRTTVLEEPHARMAMVAGDVVGFSGLAERSSSEHVANGVQRLFDALGEPLRSHRGMVSHVAGDALFAVWDLGEDAAGAERAVAFARDARAVVERVARELPLRYADGSPLRMGWGVSIGDVAWSRLATGLDTILGDPANVAFRLSTMAAREGRAEILMTAEIAELVIGDLPSAELSPMTVKGRATPVHVVSVPPA